MIDQAAKILKQAGGRELVIVSEQPARIMSETGERIAEVRSFAQWEINELVEETAPGEQLADILLGEPIEYPFRHELGNLRIRVIPGPSLWRVVLEATDEFLAAEPDALRLSAPDELLETSRAPAADSRPPTQRDQAGEKQIDKDRAIPQPPSARRVDMETAARPAGSEASPPKEATVDELGAPATAPVPGSLEKGDPVPAIHWLEDDQKDAEDAKETFSPAMAQSLPTQGRDTPDQLHPERSTTNSTASDALHRPQAGQFGAPDNPSMSRRQGSGNSLGMQDSNRSEREDDDTGDPFTWDEDLDSLAPEEIEEYRRAGQLARQKEDAPHQQTDPPSSRQGRIFTKDMAAVVSRGHKSASSQTMRAIRRPGEPPTSPATSGKPPRRTQNQPKIPGLVGLVEAAVKSGAFELHIIEGQRPWMRTGRGFGPLPQAQAPLHSPTFDEMEANLSPGQKAVLMNEGWVRFMWDGGLRAGLGRCTLVASKPRALVVHLHLVGQGNNGRLILTDDIVERAERGLTIIAGRGKCGRTTLATWLLERLISSGLRSAMVAGWPPELTPSVTAPVLSFDRTLAPQDAASPPSIAMATGMDLLLSDDCSLSDLANCLSAASQGLNVIAVKRSASLRALIRALAETAGGLTQDVPRFLTETVPQILFLEPDTDMRRRTPKLSVLVPSSRVWQAPVNAESDLASDPIAPQVIDQPPNGGH